MDEQNPRLGEVRGAGRSDYSGRAATAAPETPRTSEIRAEIEQTREDLSETVNEIQERLRPSTIAANAAESVKQTVREKAQDVADSDSVAFVTANPMPTMMVGIGLVGLVWLAKSRRPAASNGSYSRRSGDYRSGRDWRTYPLSEQSASSTRESYPRQQQTSYSTRATYGNRRPSGVDSARSYVQRTWNDSPLLVGAASVVAGAIVGLSIPETEREHELMGEARDNVLDTVQQTVREKVEHVQQAATDAVSTVQHAAKSAVGLTDQEEANPPS